jgi:hypothetical protein
MTWAPLLLADPSPLLRLRVLRSLLELPPDHPEILELSGLADVDPLAARLLAMQSADGSWKTGLTGDTAASNPVLATALVLMRLGFLGFDSSHPALRRAAEFLFSRQLPDGSWPAPDQDEESTDRERYSMRPLQTSLPLRGLASAGFARDPRAERAFDWLLAHRLPDGAWPTGIASGTYGRVAGYRKLPHSRWGCRSNTTGALICLAHHPERCTGPEARRALDLLLGRETREAAQTGFEVARLVGAEPFHGFTTFYARFDLALLLDLCARAGASVSDERVASLVDFIRGLQGPYGLWEVPSRPQVSRWLTVDLLCSLKKLSLPGASQAEWVSLEPRTPFQNYPAKTRRY